MKRIGILTFHRAINYGACLQAYALKKYIKDQGNECDIIDYHCPAIEDFYNRVFLWEDSFKTKIKKVLTWSIQKKRNIRFKQFIEKNLLDAKFGDGYNKNNISETNELYDSFITGSDQVWSPFCTGGDLTYFLDFVKDSIKCNSYAACVGIASDTFLKSQEVVSNLKRFNHISVREEIAQRKLSSILSDENREGISLDLDPTLLLSHEEWLQSFSIPQMDEKFIFNYAFFHNRPEANAAIQKISEKMGMPVYVLDSKSWAAYRLDKYGIKRYKMTGPIVFLTLMENAEWVLTQSFHGTLFSAMFHKNFWSYRAPSVNKPGDDRAIAILKQLGLADRYQVIDDLPNQNFTKTIDYANTDALISKLRSDAFSYLDKIMNSI